MKRIITKLLMLVFCLNSVFAQKQDEEQLKQSLEKGNEIIELAQKAIFKHISPKEITSLSIETKSKLENKIEKSLEDEKLLTVSTVALESNMYLTDLKTKLKIINQSQTGEDTITKRINILNGEKLFAKWEKSENGEFVDFNDSNKKNGLPILDYKSAISKTFFSETNWSEIFPLLLYNYWDQSTKFSYLGKVELPKGKLDVIALVNNSQTFTKLYFDEKTHLLSAISQTKADKTWMRRVFYENFEEKGGILLPHSINSETKSKQTDGLTLTVLGETTLANFKINPTLNPKDFEIKEEKKKLQKSDK